MTKRYAEGTTVSVERSAAELERLLVGYGATEYTRGWDGTRMAVQFARAGRRVRFTVPMPDRASYALDQRASLTQ